MIRLFQIEFRKILTYRIFWILTGLYILFLVLGLLMAEFMINNMIGDINKHMPIPLPRVTLYFFPSVWQNIAFFATIRYVLIFPAIVIMILITNEFTYKTIRQNLINGLSKAEILVSKLMIIVLLSLVMTVLLTLGTLILGLSNTADASPEMILDKAVFMGGFFLTMFTFQVFALFCGFLLRNTGLSIAIFTLYALIIEPILYYFLKSPLVFENKISRYLPVNSVISITEYPAIPVLKQVMGLDLQGTVTLTGCLIPLGYAAAMIGIVYWVLRKRDL